MPQYLGQSVAHVDVRPKRACYLVPQGSAAGFSAAIDRACSRWGGVQEVILPVSTAGRIRPAWVQIAKILKPDVAFNVGAMSEAARQRVATQIGLKPLDVRHEDHAMYGAHVLLAFPQRP